MCMFSKTDPGLLATIVRGNPKDRPGGAPLEVGWRVYQDGRVRVWKNLFYRGEIEAFVAPYLSCQEFHLEEAELSGLMRRLTLCEDKTKLY